MSAWTISSSSNLSRKFAIIFPLILQAWAWSIMNLILAQLIPWGVSDLYSEHVLLDEAFKQILKRLVNLLGFRAQMYIYIFPCTQKQTSPN